MTLDPTKPVELTVKSGLFDLGNYYPQGRYEPGALPAYFLKPEYCRNISLASPSPVVGEGIALEPLSNERADSQPLVAKPVDLDKLNINTADINQISKIEGISTGVANKILIDRDTNGNYKDAADLIARQNLSKLANTINDRFSF